MTGWRLTSSMPAMMRCLSSCFDTTRMWRRTRWGPELARIERLKKALDDTERAGGLLLTFITSLSSDEIVRRAEAGEAGVREALNS